jgi:hypothetical protein
MASWFVTAPEKANSPVKRRCSWYWGGTIKDNPISSIERRSVIKDLDMYYFSYFLLTIANLSE